ncbi:MAG: four helix bundle protein [Proteobacteria bacterium]|nr:four helix bundle protein [Pseudomonadota bacterium]
MAKYENLPIYRRAMELLVYVEQVVRGFPRYHKYATGARLRNLCFELTSLIVRANNTYDHKERTEVLRQLRDTAEEVKICLVASKELKAFKSYSSFNHAAKMAVDICRQGEGWLKSTKRSPSPESYPRPDNEARP